MLNSKTLRLNIILILMNIMWASAYVGIRVGLTGYSPGCLALLRFITASICMLFIYYRWGARKPITPRDLLSCALMGIAGFTVYHITLNTGEITVSASVASFIISQIPVLMTLLAVLFLGERLTIIGWLGTLISFAGIGLIAISEQSAMRLGVGLIYLVVTMLAGAIYAIFQKPLLKRIAPIDFTAYALWFGTAFLLGYLPQLLHELPKAPASATGAVIYLGIFPAAIAYILWSYALKNLPASKAGSYLYAIPPCTLLIGWLVLNEMPPLLAIVGGLAALGGSILVHRGVKKEVII